MDGECGGCESCALQPMLGFLEEHRRCGGCFGVTVRLAAEHRCYSLTCAGCRAEFKAQLPGEDARYAVILQSLAQMSAN